MKSVRRYVIVIGLVFLGIAFAYFYQQYLGEDVDPQTKLPPSSVIQKRLNAIITDTARSEAQTITFPQALKIDYVDMESREASSFYIAYPDRVHVAIGDTVSKDKGEKLVLVYKKQGTVASVPVE
ncbi:hypothetical protein [Spirosoma aerophilum]